MTYENVVLDGHALTNEGMARDFAAVAYLGVLLDLDKGTDLCLVSNLTAIKVDEFG